MFSLICSPCRRASVVATAGSRHHHDVITTSSRRQRGAFLRGKSPLYLDDFCYFCCRNFIRSYKKGSLEFLKMVGMDGMREGGDTSGFFIRPMNLFSQKALKGNMSRSILTETL